MSVLSKHSRVEIILWVVIGAAAALSHRAQAKGEEDAAITRGLDLRRQGKDEAALKEFQNSYDETRSSRAAAQMGLAEQALGRWVDAETHVSQALSDQSHPWILKNTPVLNRALEEIRRHVGSLEIMGPSGAEVRVNGEPVGTLPFSKPVRMPIGTLNVVLRKAGYLTSTRPVTISAGSLTRESVNLDVIETAPSQAPPRPHVRTDVMARAGEPQSASSSSVVRDGVNDAPEREGDDVAADRSSGSWQRPLAWVTAGVALLGAAGGGVALFLRNQKLSDANKLECHVMSGIVNPTDPTNNTRCLDLANTSSKMGLTAAVAFSAAAVFAISSGVLFATMPESSPSASVACAPALTNPGAICQLRF